MRIALLVASVFSASLALPGLALAEGTKTGDQGQKQEQAKKQEQSKSQTAAPVVLLVPVLTANDDAMANGCWARLYDKAGFSGSMLTLSGTVEIPAMRSGHIAGFEWDRNFDSVIVGPKATLKAWKDDDYKGDTTTIGANQRVRDLDGKMGYFEDINSLKLNCATQ